jgi:hypothetical protein
MAKRSSVCVLTHGHCFDGLASAVVFTALWRELRNDTATPFEYRSCGYGPNLPSIPEAWLRGTENALLDFRFADSARLGWYFDHHATAFASDEQRERALAPERARSGRRVFFDPTRPSCAGLVAEVARRQFTIALDGLSELVKWADRIDAARFESAEEAFFARQPALALADVVERAGDGKFLQAIVPALLERSLHDVVRLPSVAEPAGQIAAQKEAYLARVRGAAKTVGEVAAIDLSDAVAQAAGKFPQYVACPDSRYSVVLLRTADQLKLGVGYNPWSGKPRLHHLARLCQSEGGGGHAVVGGVAFAASELERARGVLARFVEALNAPDPLGP